MRRFTDTAKWDDPWFRGLSGPHKLVFLYVIDRCNNAGFWEYDEDAVIFHTKLKQETVEGACKALTRGLKGAGGWVWVKNFLKHQKNDELKLENPAHRQIISLLRDQLDRFSEIPEFQQFVAPYMGLVRPIGIGKGSGNGIPEGEVQEGKQRKGSKKNITRVTVIDPLALRIGALFGRKAETPWLKHEWDKFTELKPQESEIEDIEWLYSTEYEFKKHSLTALLNEWMAELDKVAKHASEKPKQRYSPNL